MSGLEVFGLFCLLLVLCAIIGFGFFASNQVSYHKMDDKYCGWCAYMVLSFIMSLLISAAVFKFSNHPEIFGYQEIPVEQTAEETTK